MKCCRVWELTHCYEMCPKAGNWIPRICEIMGIQIAILWEKLNVKMQNSYQYNWNQVATGWPGFDSQQGQGYFIFSTASRMAPGSTQPPIRTVPDVKRPGREADHWPPPKPKLRMHGNIPLIHHTSSWRGT